MKLENPEICEIYELESARREKLMNARFSTHEKEKIRPKTPKLENKSVSTTNLEISKKPLQRESNEIKLKPKIVNDTPRSSIQFDNKQLDSIENQINTHLKELETNRSNFRISDSYFSASSSYLDDLENFNPSALYRSKKLETLYKSKSGSKKKFSPLYRNYTSLNFDLKLTRPNFEYSIKPSPIKSNNFLFNPSIIDSEFFLDNEGLTEVEKIRNQLKEDYNKIPSEIRARSVSSQKSAKLQKLTNMKNTIDFGSTLQLKEKLRAIAQKHQIKNFYLNSAGSSSSASNSASKLNTIPFKNSVFKQNEDQLENSSRVKSSLNLSELDSEQKDNSQVKSESLLNINSQFLAKPKIVGYSEPKTSTVKPTDNPLARINFTFLRSSSINRPFMINNSTQNSFRNPISINGRSYFLSDDMNRRNIRLINKTSKVNVNEKLTKVAENQKEVKEEFGSILGVSKSSEKIKLSV